MTLTNAEHLFPKIEKKGAAAADPNARTFLGSGGNLLLVPGCRQVDAVRVGNTAVPEFIDEEYPVGFDSNGVPSLEGHRVPLYQLVETEDGPALQRSVKSNDGIWQSGETVVVVGVWSDSPGSLAGDSMGLRGQRGLRGEEPSPPAPSPSRPPRTSDRQGEGK